MAKRMMRLSDLISNYALPWLLLLLLLRIGCGVSESEEIKTYIIHLDHSQKPAIFLTHETWHRSILKSLSDPVNDEEMLLYSYNHVLNGFSARLTKSQLSEIEKSPIHLATFQESFGKALTTHSPKFLGLNRRHGLWPTASYGEGVIIGVVDTGIWPESESFNDRGMPPLPQRWKGKCENGTEFGRSNCNRKLIGARSFSKGLRAAGLTIPPGLDYDSARDFAGHGTFTSSTAAGNYVLGASCFGYARGTARGVAPSAHVAMYKALFVTDVDITNETAVLAAKTDILAAMDWAIADGVDILSLSLGLGQSPFFNDSVAIGALSATEKGIFVVCAAGNDGAAFTVGNTAPWITTVGAGTLDRSFTATLTLENGLTLEGTSYFPGSIYITDTPLYYSKAHRGKAICYHGELNPSEVHGKIVLCDNSTKVDLLGQEKELARVGAYAGIFVSDTAASLFAPVNYTIPNLVLSTASGNLLREYVTAKTKVKSLKFASTNLATKPAPQVAYFSSRGPDPTNPGILKPDILAPGMNVLAAYAPNRPYMTLGIYNLVTDYALGSGTSAAAPHVAGVAALLKNVHPEWSPAAIRSAMMTTAYIVDNTGTILKDQLTGLPATPLEFGAGHINPNKAMDPGLIYDMGSQDYIDFLCSLNYTRKQIHAVIRQSQWNCSKELSDLNYPSFMAVFTNKTGSPTVKTFSRVVTNVGNDIAAYQATIENIPPGMKISVEPSTLSFNQKYLKQSFSLSLEIAKETPTPAVRYAYLKWTDQHNHIVSSPIVAVKLPLNALN